MSTEFTCPRCGNTETFTASAIILYGSILIDDYGWDWSGSCDSELTDNALLSCIVCGYEANHREFEKKQVHGAFVKGVLQDYDLTDTRFDVERVGFDVPVEMLGAFSEKEFESMRDGYFGCGEDSPFGKLVGKALEAGLFKPQRAWTTEDPCELRIYIC